MSGLVRRDVTYSVNISVSDGIYGGEAAGQPLKSVGAVTYVDSFESDLRTDPETAVYVPVFIRPGTRTAPREADFQLDWRLEVGVPAQGTKQGTQAAPLDEDGDAPA